MTVPSLKMTYVSTGMLSAAASLGMILLWDVDGGLTQIDKYLYSSEDYIKVNFTASFLIRSGCCHAPEYLSLYPCVDYSLDYSLFICNVSPVSSLVLSWPVASSTLE